MGLFGIESFLECGIVNVKIRNILGKLGSLIILEGKDNRKLDLGIGKLEGIKIKCRESNWMYNLEIEEVMVRDWSV